MRRFLILCLMGLNGLTARAATTLPDLNATPATLPNGISVTGAVTLPAASIADAALSSNIPLKNAANTFTLGPNIFQSGAAGNIGLIVRAAATPTASFFSVQDSASIAQFRVDSAGNTQIGSATQNSTLNFGNGIDTRKTTISVTPPAVSNTYTIPDVGGAANFALSNGQGTATTLLHGSVAGIPAYGAAVLTTDVSGILPTANGGTGIAFFTAAGPTVARVYTFPDAATTILTTNAAVTVAQGGTGVATLTANGVLYGNAAGNVLVTAAGTNNTLLHGNTSAAPTYSAVALASDVTGTLADGNLSSNVPLKNAANTFTAAQTINAAAGLTLQGGVNGGGDIRTPVNTSVRIGNTGTVASALAIGNAASGQVGLGFNMDNSVGATSIYNSAIRAFQLYINSGSGIIMQTYTGAGVSEANLYFNPGGSTNMGLGFGTDAGIQRDGVSTMRITDGTNGGNGALKATTGTFIAATNQLILGAAAGPNITMTAPAPVASRTLTIPDTGAAANFVMTQGAQTIAGSTTFSSAVNVTPTTNQLVFGVTSTTTISAIAPTASRTYTIDDVGGAAKFAMAASQGTATTLLHGSAAGVPSYLAVSLTADVTGILPTANGGTGIAYFTAAGPTVARVYTFPDAATTVLTTNSAVTTAQGGTGVGTFTANGVLYGNAAGNVLVTAAGANNTLLHGNTGAAPTYSAVSMTADVTGILPLANGGTNRTDGAPGAFIQTTTLTSGTSFTTTANTRTIIIRVQGGGGGGGSDASVAAQNSAGGGGSAGGYAEKVFTVAGSTAYTYAIGAAGAGGTAGGSGSAGGASTFTVGATTVTANGGLGGNGSASYNGVGVTLGGSSPAVSTNGDVNSGGAPGGAGLIFNATVVAISGAGGSCIFGAGGNSVNAQGAGLAGVGNGAGGSGGVVVNGGAVTAGGAGLAGIITVDEYR